MVTRSLRAVYFGIYIFEDYNYFISKIIVLTTTAKIHGKDQIRRHVYMYVCVYVYICVIYVATSIKEILLVFFEKNGTE